MPGAEREARRSPAAAPPRRAHAGSHNARVPCSASSPPAPPGSGGGAGAPMPPAPALLPQRGQRRSLPAPRRGSSRSGSGGPAVEQRSGSGSGSGAGGAPAGPGPGGRGGGASWDRVRRGGGSGRGKGGSGGSGGVRRERGSSRKGEFGGAVGVALPSSRWSKGPRRSGAPAELPASPLPALRGLNHRLKTLKMLLLYGPQPKIDPVGQETTHPCHLLAELL